MKHLNGTFEPDPERPSWAGLGPALVVVLVLLGLAGFAAFAAPELLVEAFSAGDRP